MVDKAAGQRVPADLAVRITVPKAEAEVLGAILMERLGPFEQQEGEGPGGAAVSQAPAGSEAPAGPGGSVETGQAAGPGRSAVVLVFYPPPGTVVSRRELVESLPPGLVSADLLDVEVREVARDWVDGWRRHFRPTTVEAVRVRPPWIPALDGQESAGAPSAGGLLADVVIDPGLGFGTGLHPTTRGTLRLLQRGQPGPLVDAGTGSGVLAIAAAKLGWTPVLAFDNDAVALAAARSNVAANEVVDLVRLEEAGIDAAPLEWFCGAAVLANMTLEPVCHLVRRLASACEVLPTRLVVSGVTSGRQEAALLQAAGEAGFRPRRRLYEAEWVSVELVPAGGTG